MVRMKRMVFTAVMAAGVAVTACSGPAGKMESSVSQEAEIETKESVEPGTKESPVKENVSTQEADTRSEEKNADDVRAETGEKTEIKIGLPDNEKWYSGAEYSVEGDTIQQVIFHDEITDSDAIVRACRKEDGDPSVFYYMFDGSKEQSLFANTSDGTRVDIKVEVTVENSDIHGVLATWECNGILYALWEDDGAGDVSSVAKLAVEIAKRSE